MGDPLLLKEISKSDEAQGVFQAHIVIVVTFSYKSLYDQDERPLPAAGTFQSGRPVDLCNPTLTVLLSISKVYTNRWLCRLAD
jgi:hypothetical protein